MTAAGTAERERDRDRDPDDGGPGRAPSPRRGSHPARWIAVIVAVVMAAFVGLLATRKPADVVMAQSPLLGREAPPIAGTALDGNHIDLTSFRGKWVLVNFFQARCIPCQTEQPELVKFAARHHAAGDAEILAVLFDDTPDAARAFFERKGGTWPAIDDPNGKVALDYGVRGPPESFLVDPNGIVRTKFIGAVTDKVLEQLVVQGQAPS